MLTAYGAYGSVRFALVHLRGEVAWAAPNMEYDLSLPPSGGYVSPGGGNPTFVSRGRAATYSFFAGGREYYGNLPFPSAGMHKVLYARDAPWLNEPADYEPVYDFAALLGGLALLVDGVRASLAAWRKRSKVARS